MSGYNQRTPVPSRTPRARNKRTDPPEAELPNIEPAANTTYGSSIPALPDQAETGANILQRSIAHNIAQMPAPRKSKAASVTAASVTTAATPRRSARGSAAPSVVMEELELPKQKSRGRGKKASVSQPPSRTFGEESAAAAELQDEDGHASEQSQATEYSRPLQFSGPSYRRVHATTHDPEDDSDGEGILVTDGASLAAQTETMGLFRSTVRFLVERCTVPLVFLIAVILALIFLLGSLASGNSFRTDLPRALRTYITGLSFPWAPATKTYTSEPAWSTVDGETMDSYAKKLGEDMNKGFATLETKMQNQILSAVESGFDATLLPKWQSFLGDLKADQDLFKDPQRLWAKFFAEHEYSMRAFVDEEIRKHVATNMKDADVAAMASTSLNHLRHQGLDRVNWFSPAWSATIENRITSPTWFQPFTVAKRLTSKFIFIGQRPSRPPAEVLYSWEEPDDRWCSSNTTDEKYLGNAQFGIALPHQVYPTDVTIEFYPRAAMPDVRAAPKDMEVWVNVPNMTQHLRVHQVSTLLLGPTPPRGTKLDRTFLRVATFRYDPHEKDHIQNFPVQINLTEMGIPVDSILVRATTNWGGEFTCFYRARLGGKLVDESRKDPRNREINGSRKGSSILGLFF